MAKQQVIATLALLIFGIIALFMPILNSMLSNITIVDPEIIKMFVVLGAPFIVFLLYQKYGKKGA